MGWADCGTDSKGRPIGYAFEAVCDHPGCDTKIDRGVAHACGGMHGDEPFSCEGYFCSEHLTFLLIDDDELDLLKQHGYEGGPTCPACTAAMAEWLDRVGE